MQLLRIALLPKSFAATFGSVIQPRQANGCNCAGNVYDTRYLVNSIGDAQAGVACEYPHQYHDYEGFTLDCSTPFYEYPIIAGDQQYSGGSPGAGNFCESLARCPHVYEYKLGSQ